MGTDDTRGTRSPGRGPLLTRRQALSLAGCAGVALAGSSLAARLALADDDSGGGGGSDARPGQGGTSGETWYASGQSFVWFDRGGFTREDGTSLDPVQGWDADSVTYFLGLMNQRMATVAQNPNIKFEADRIHYSVGQKTNMQLYTDAANAALTRARDRARARAAASGRWYSGKARLVFVGWAHYAGLRASDGGYYGIYGDDGWEIAANWDTHFADLCPRACHINDLSPNDTSWALDTKEMSLHEHGSSTSLTGWNQAVDDPDYAGDTWAQYIYHLGHDDLGDADNYSVIALAVADGWPEKLGKIAVRKQVSTPW